MVNWVSKGNFLKTALMGKIEGNFVPRDVPGRDSLKKSRPVPSRGKILSLSRCPFVPGQKKFLVPLSPLSRENQRTSVPLSRGTRKLCPVGNPSTELFYNPLLLEQRPFELWSRGDDFHRKAQQRIVLQRGNNFEVHSRYVGR